MPEIEATVLPAVRTHDVSAAVATALPRQRPHVESKFLYCGSEKLWVRGVTYGPFCPDEKGSEYHDIESVERDFAQMAANGLNAVRTYTVPPRWLLDAAYRHGLYVMVGLPWEQHIAFLDDTQRALVIEARVRAMVRVCAGHPAILCYAIGNEIPAHVVRWHGARRVERFLKRLYLAAKEEDPEALFTYVNYPSTEYLQLPFLDLLCFNVYLESQERLEAYLARLQNLAGDRPLIMGEIGLDSRRNGHDKQAEVLSWQVQTAFAAGCTGTFVFAWTDEWHRGGFDIDDWDFGLTDRQRHPKPALAAVRQAYVNTPFPAETSWPMISVVVCTYNGNRTIRDCCEGLLQLDYPNFEVIVVNDGSTDGTEATVREYGFHVISTENRGLSNARNTGMEAAHGEIVAYIDDDAYPDPHWLTYLAATFMNSTHAAVGGPNLPPPGDGPIAECVANAPGGPVHVLVSDTEAEHIPGCNMAFRKAHLQAVGGFDPQFRTAGDDVDICWRLQERGWTLGFSPAAVVWHHRRGSVRTYWKQQQGYGKAEALLEHKWPSKYNWAGHMVWHGRLYGKGLMQTLGWKRQRIYQGTWGSAPYQSVYEPAPSTLASFTMMPEWYLVIAFLAALSLLGLLWQPLLWAFPGCVAACGALLVQAGLGARKASFLEVPPTRFGRLKLRAITAGLHLMQPLARLRGRLRHGLTLWRWQQTPGAVFCWQATRTLWNEEWQAPVTRLQNLVAALQQQGIGALCGGDYDRWDLEVRSGTLGGARLHMLVEDHSAGRQLARFCIRPRYALSGLLLPGGLAALALGALAGHAWLAAVVLGSAAGGVALRTMRECASAMTALLQAIAALGKGEV